MEDILALVFGFILGRLMVQLYKAHTKPPEIEPCKLHRWVLDDINKELYCETCGRTPGEKDVN